MLPLVLPVPPTRQHVAVIRVELVTARVAVDEGASVVDEDAEIVVIVETEEAEVDEVAPVEVSRARLVQTGLPTRSLQLLQPGVRRLRKADYMTLRSMTALRSIPSGERLDLTEEVCIA